MTMTEVNISRLIYGKTVDRVEGNTVFFVGGGRLVAAEPVANFIPHSRIIYTKRSRGAEYKFYNSRLEVVLSLNLNGVSYESK